MANKSYTAGLKKPHISAGVFAFNQMRFGFIEQIYHDEIVLDAFRRFYLENYFGVGRSKIKASRKHFWRGC